MDQGSKGQENYGTQTARGDRVYEAKTRRVTKGGRNRNEGLLYDRNVTDPSFDEVVIMLDELANAQPYLQVDHRYMNGPAIDQVFADEGSGTGNQVLWYLSDSQNTVRDVAKYTTVTTGATAKIRNHLEYDSFGNVTSVDDPTTAANTSDGDLPGLQGGNRQPVLAATQLHRPRTGLGDGPDLLPSPLVRPATGPLHQRRPHQLRRR